MSKSKTETREPDYGRATILANAFQRGVEDAVSPSAWSPDEPPTEQDVLFALAMTLAYLSRQYGAVSSDVMRALRKCLDAPIVRIPPPKRGASA